MRGRQGEFHSTQAHNGVGCGIGDTATRRPEAWSNQRGGPQSCYFHRNESRRTDEQVVPCGLLALPRWLRAQPTTPACHQQSVRDARYCGAGSSLMPPMPSRIGTALSTSWPCLYSQHSVEPETVCHISRKHFQRARATAGLLEFPYQGCHRVSDTAIRACIPRGHSFTNSHRFKEGDKYGMTNSHRLKRRDASPFTAEFEKALAAVQRATNLLIARRARLRAMRDAAYDQPSTPREHFLAIKSTEGRTH